MKNSTIKIKNELPELLEAVCLHKDCPEWLRDDIWESFNNQSGRVTFAADWWRGQLASIPTEQDLLRRMEAQNNESEHAN